MTISEYNIVEFPQKNRLFYYEFNQKVNFRVKLTNWQTVNFFLLDGLKQSLRF